MNPSTILNILNFRYIVILNYKNILNNECKSHVFGFYIEIEDAYNDIEADIKYRIQSAKEYEEATDSEIHEGYNSLNISDNEYFSYDIHDLCAEDWSCINRA